jgi:Transposase, Mutator family
MEIQCEGVICGRHARPLRGEHAESRIGVLRPRRITDDDFRYDDGAHIGTVNSGGTPGDAPSDDDTDDTQAMSLEREQFLGTGHYERDPQRRGYANGYKAKKVDTQAGTLHLDVPKTAGTAEPFYPQSLERGRRSCRAVMLAAAEMYLQGVSTRDVEKILKEFGIEGLSSW